MSKYLIQNKYEVDIVTCNTDHSPTYEEIDGIHIYRLPAWNILKGTFPIPKPNQLTLEIMKVLRNNRYNVVITHTRFMLTSLLGLIYAKVHKVPLIHIEHGTSHCAVSDNIVSLINQIYDHTIGSLIIRLANKRVAVSHCGVEFVAHLGGKVDVVIPNSIHANSFTKRSSNIKDKLKLNNCIVVTYVGRLIYAKGVHDLIAVFNEVVKKIDNLRLIIVGDGNYRESLEHMVSAECRDKIFFLGQLDTNSIIDILNISDIFVNPSYSEGLPTTVLEAAAASLPIIATDVGGTSEIIADNKTGLLFSPGDINLLRTKLVELVVDKDLREELGCNARKYVVENFNWSTTGELFLHLIEDYSQ